MARDHRIIDADGQRVPYSCQNSAYRTNINKGEPHGPNSETRGSVFRTSLVAHGDSSLWLEHVVELQTGAELYWLMWYWQDGTPSIPLSGVLNRSELSRMIGQLAQFIP